MARVEEGHLVGHVPHVLTHAQQFDVRLKSVEARERSVALPEYLLHRNDIDAAMAALRTK